MTIRPLAKVTFTNYGWGLKGKGERGYIYINRTDEGKLEISKLEETLRTAIANGLKLAIFNSCDGLGLARQLERLHIPQVIVMQEPVRHKIAQEFLKYFLIDFSRGMSLYTSVRRARKMLRGWCLRQGFKQNIYRFFISYLSFVICPLSVPC